MQENSSTSHNAEADVANSKTIFFFFVNRPIRFEYKSETIFLMFIFNRCFFFFFSHECHLAVPYQWNSVCKILQICSVQFQAWVLEWASAKCRHILIIQHITLIRSVISVRRIKYEIINRSVFPCVLFTSAECRSSATEWTICSSASTCCGTA